MEIHVVIMAGGVGSRFWPMSVPEYPKQFIDVMGCGKSLIQMTVERFLPICPVKNMWVVTSAKYIEIVKEQLPEIPMENVLAEPEARNTAPCIAYACWKIKKAHPEANIVVTPSDALVIDSTEYRRVICKALDFTEKSDKIVTIGIKPTRPETGYGYICTEPDEVKPEIHKVAEFKEKPNLETAKQYLAAGNYLWNAGIFVWNVKTITDSLTQYAPQITGLMERMAEAFYTPSESEIVGELFPQCEKISIDYAVMEKSSKIYTIPGDFGWSDLGTWGSLWVNIPQKDSDGNACVGVPAQMYDSHNCVVHTSSLKKVVIQGLDGYIVAEKNGSLLICQLKEEQRIKEFQK